MGFIGNIFAPSGGIEVNQTVTSRILGYGTLIISSMGGTQDFYTNVPNPLAFRRYVQRQVDLLIDEAGVSEKR